MPPSPLASTPPSPPASHEGPAPPPASGRHGVSHRVVRGPEALFAIERPDVNVVLWRRPLGPLLGRRLGPLFCDLGAAFDGPLSAQRRDVARLASALPTSPLCDMLACDLGSLVGRFVALSGERRPHARLEVVDDDGCRKFHCDYVGLRLIVTYFGPGTEWLPDGAVDRGALVPSTLSPDEANAAVVRDGGRVRRARAGDVLLLKGEAWPGNAGRGAVHRSPPVAAAGKRRLVFKLTALAPGRRHGQSA